MTNKEMTGFYNVANSAESRKSHRENHRESHRTKHRENRKTRSTCATADGVGEPPYLQHITGDSQGALCPEALKHPHLLSCTKTDKQRLR